MFVTFGVFFWTYCLSKGFFYTPIQPVSQNQKISHRRHVLNCRFVRVISCIIFRYVYDPAVRVISHAYFQYPFTAISWNPKKIFAQPPCYSTIYRNISLQMFRIFQYCYLFYLRRLNLVSLDFLPSQKLARPPRWYFVIWLVAISKVSCLVIVQQNTKFPKIGHLFHKIHTHARRNTHKTWWPDKFTFVFYRTVSRLTR
jgi:hypothetical protein